MSVDGFLLERQLPGGRHGAVWKATDAASGTAVALKQLHGLDPDAFERVQAEVDRVRLLSDRHVTPCRPPATDGGDHWLVEDWVDGLSLAEVLAGQAALTRQQALGIVRAVLLGLRTAHRADVVHGELSPRSVMIDTEGEPVLVGFAAHLADASVAQADEFAAPEANSESQARPTADVYSVGLMLDQLLATDGTPAELEPVVKQATAALPTTRYPDADAFLEDLEHRAERAFGAGWWTTAGLSGIAATGSAAAAAGTVGAVAGSGGAVSGALSSGAGALTGATSSAGAGAVRGGLSAGVRTGLALAGTAVVLVALVVGATALLRPSGTERSAADTAAVGPSQAATDAAYTPTPAAQTPSPTSAKSPATSRPTPKPNPVLSFTGKYRYERVVTKSNRSDTPVGERDRTTWTVATTCSGSVCYSDVTDGDGDSFQLDTSKRRWKEDFTYKAKCVWVDTGKYAGEKVKMRYTRTLTPKISDQGIVSVSGTARLRALQNCTDEVGPKDDIHYKITIKRIK